MGTQIKGTETPNDEKKNIFRNDSFVLESGDDFNGEGGNGIEV